MKKIFIILLSVFVVMGATAASFAATAADGTYSVSASLSGGTGKATITSATLIVSGGSMKARVVWSSSSYTWMKVGGVQYNNENSGGQSTFTIPVSALDTPIPVSAETTAMSEPHVIDYTLTISSSGVTMQDSSASQGGSSDSPSSSSGGVQASDGNKNQTAASSPAESEEPAAHQENSADSDVIAVENAYSKATSVSAEALAGYEGKTMILSTVRGMVAFDKTSTAYIAQAAKGGITLTMEDLSEKDEYKDQNYDLVVDLTLEDEEGNALYSKGDNGKATVTLNYDKEIEEGAAVKVYRISDDSKEEVESSYDSEAKTVTFETEHFSVYAVAQDNQGSGNTAVVIVIAAAVVIAVVGAAIFAKKKKVK